MTALVLLMTAGSLALGWSAVTAESPTLRPLGLLLAAALVWGAVALRLGTL